MKNIVLLTQVGLSMITPIFLGLWIGRKLDNLVGSKYIFSIIMILLGIASGFLQVYKLITRANKKSSSKSSNTKDDKYVGKHIYEINFDEDLKGDEKNGK